MANVHFLGQPERAFHPSSHPHPLPGRVAAEIAMDSNTFYSSTRSPYHHAVHPSFQCNNCGRAYSNPRHLDQHQRQCSNSKRDLSDLLEETKAFWESRKRRKVEAGGGSSGSSVLDSNASSTGELLAGVSNVRKSTHLQRKRPLMHRR